jgi:carboxyl-terminal processing protease
MAEKFDARLNGSEYEGIGAWVDISGDYLKIISPMPGSPAEKAGLEAGDIVIAVDGEDMTGIDGDLVLKRIIGPKDTQVILTIQREGELEPLDFEITRAVITTPLIESRMLENNIGYVRLYTFGDSTAGDLRNALRELLAQNPQGLVLDLRSNGGGYLAAAIDVASEFIGDGVLLYEEFSDGRRDVLRAESGGLATKIPLVVLVNEGSASASEIVAGAIQDRGRGLLVGVKTFGKGLVQTVHMLENDQGQVRVTTARWLTPNERQINKLGLTPNHIVEVTEEDRQADRDPQLDKAIELLSR